MKINKGKCNCCGQDIVLEISQPTVLLCSSTQVQDNIFTVLPSSEVGGGNFYQLGQEFRRWWDSHVAVGFSDGFLEK